MLNKLRSIFVKLMLLVDDVFGIFISMILFLCIYILYIYNKINFVYYIFSLLVLINYHGASFLILYILSKYNLSYFIIFDQIKKFLFSMYIVFLLFTYFKIEMILRLTVLAILLILYILYYFLINIFSRFIADIVDIAEHFILCKKIKNLKNYCVFNIESIKFCNFLLIILICCYYYYCILDNLSYYNIIMLFLILLEILLLDIICIGDSFNYQYKKSKILINNYNIDYKKFLNKRIVTFGVVNDYQIMEIDLNDIFPLDSRERKVYVTNQFCYYNDLVEDSAILAIALPRISQNKKLDIYFTYKLKDGKKIKRKCTLYLAIRNQDFGVYIENYKFGNFKIALLNYEKQIKYLKNNNFDELYIPLNSIKYDSEIRKDIDFISQLEPRKWLLHNKKFGFGKSLYDLNFAMSLGLQPIIISPWESNYDNDILQLIFNKLSSKYGNPTSIILDKNVLPFACVSFAGLYLFVFDIMKKIYVFLQSIIMASLEKNIIKDFLSSNDNLIQFLYYTIIFMALWLCVLKLLPSLILLKKDNSKIYQEYYIKQIVKIFEYNKYICFIIEDVDRLDIDVYNEIFRILSLINKYMCNRKTFIGIISLDENSLGSYTKNFEDIKNKLICYEIGTEYNQSATIKKYTDDAIIFLQKYSDKDLATEYEKIKEKYCKKSEHNFRDVKQCINALINDVVEKNN